MSGWPGGREAEVTQVHGPIRIAIRIVIRAGRPLLETFALLALFPLARAAELTAVHALPARLQGSLWLSLCASMLAYLLPAVLAVRVLESTRLVSQRLDGALATRAPAIFAGSPGGTALAGLGLRLILLAVFGLACSFVLTRMLDAHWVQAVARLTRDDPHLLQRLLDNSWNILQVSFITSQWTVCALLFAVAAYGQLKLIDEEWRTLWFLRKAHVAASQRGAPASPALRSRRSPGPLRLAHWSDLHFTCGPSALRLESQVSPWGSEAKFPCGGNSRLGAIVRRHRERLDACDLVLCTGDLTDAGEQAEWSAVIGALEALGIDRKIVCVPGNHDVNVITRKMPLLAFEPRPRVGRARRLVRMMNAMERFQGERARVAWGVGWMRTLREILDEQLGWRKDREAMPSEVDAVERVWAAIFPMVVEFEEQRIALFILDSNDSSYHVATNAFGRLRRGALERLDELASQYTARGLGCAYALHHHVSLPKTLGAGGVGARGLVLANPHDFVATLQRHPSSVVFHGHRHLSYDGSIEGTEVHVVAAASTTLGQKPEGETDLGFQIHALSTSAGGVLDCVRDGEACVTPLSELG